MTRAFAALLGVALIAGQATAAGLTNASALSSAYDAILDADFARVPALLTSACGSGWDTPARPPSGPRLLAPPVACRVMDVVSRWWQLQRDPLDRSGDAEFERRATAAIAEVEAWSAAEPSTAEAWFYVGAAYSTRVQWRVLRGQRLAAARDGKRIKEALERALALDPQMQEAYFGIGLYHYYADVAPTAAKILRWLLLLPGGDKTRGMQEMLRAREHGALLRDEADYQLQLIDLWYEKQPQRALDLLSDLRRRHPRNPLFPQLIAQVQDVYLHDLAASLRTWRTLLDAADTRRVAYPDLAETRARLGIASVFERMANTDAAIEQLRAVIAAKPLAPFGAYAQAQRDLARLQSRSRDSR